MVRPVTNQRTLAQPLRLSGLTLHAGVPVSCTVTPAGIGHGLIFRRLDSLPEVADVTVAPSRLVAAPLCSRIANEGGTSISTLEHLMAAFRVYGITNALITLDGPEVPILDGSALPWVRAIEEAGVFEQDCVAAMVELQSPVRVSYDDRHATLMPLQNREEAATFTARIEFASNGIGAQSFSGEARPAFFNEHIAAARSFVEASELPALQSKGLVRGGSLANAVVFDAVGVRNPEGLRFPDEPARHKVLDAMGDMYLGGVQILAHYQGYKAGHALHAALLRTLFADETAWRWTEESVTSKVVAMDHFRR